MGLEETLPATVLEDQRCGRSLSMSALAWGRQLNFVIAEGQPTYEDPSLNLRTRRGRPDR